MQNRRPTGRPSPERVVVTTTLYELISILCDLIPPEEEDLLVPVLASLLERQSKNGSIAVNGTFIAALMDLIGVRPHLVG